MMVETSNPGDNVTRWLRQTARIWGLVIIGIALIVIIGHLISPDSGTADYPPIENLIPLTMFLSILGLAIAWRWELVGGAINIGFFLACQGVFMIIHHELLELWVIAMLSPIFIPGVLFLVCWWRSRRSVRS